MNNLDDHKWNNFNWAKSNHPTSSEKWIYLVAGDRNIQMANGNQRLWCNLGETSGLVEDRLEDSDYGRKAAGGNWVILNKWRVPSWISDKDIHAIIKQNIEVIWKDSRNTEEFLFVGDYGDGKMATPIIESAIREAMMAKGNELIAGIKVEQLYLRKKLKENEVALSKKEQKEAATIERKETSPVVVHVKDTALAKRLLKIPSVGDISLGLAFSITASAIFTFLCYLMQPAFLTFIFIYFPIYSCLGIAAQVWWIKSMIKSAISGT